MKNKIFNISLFLLLPLIVIFFSLVGCNVPSKQGKEETVETKIESKEAQVEETIEEKKEEVEIIPTLKILSVNGMDDDNNIFETSNNNINGNISLIAVDIEIENFDIDKDKIETVWEFNGQEVYRSNEIIEDTGNLYKVGVSKSEGFFISGDYKCSVYLNDSLTDSIEFKVSQPDLDPVEISGTGTFSSDFFNIAGGLTIFEFKNSGSGNFIVYLFDEDGNEIELIVNEIGSVSGKNAMYLPSGTYFMNIEHGATWSFQIKQPRSFDVKTIPYTFSGNSPDISDLITIDGLIEINYSYSGEGNFIVYILNELGQQVELLANEIGSISGSTTFKGDGNKYFISVKLAEGNYEFILDYK